MEHTSHRSPLLEAAVLAYAFLSLLSVGLGLIITAWLATGLGSVRLVGQLFFIGSATSLVCGFFAGMIVDHCSRLFVVRLGQSLRLLGATVLVVGVAHGHASMVALVAFTLGGAAGLTISAGALDGIFQTVVPGPLRIKVAVRVAVVRQVGFATGTGLGGILLHAYPPVVLAAIILSILLSQLALSEKAFRRFSHVPQKRPSTFGAFWKDGLATVWETRDLPVAIAMIALLHSVAQMTNVLVPGFVQDVLGRGSDVYGLLEAAWALGGGAILVAAALPKKFAGRGRIELVLLGAIGLLMIGFANLRMVPALVGIYALLGACFALARALCEGRILTLAPPAKIGRVRSMTTVMMSVVGLAVYASPTVLDSDDTVLFYIAFGGAIALSSVGLYAMSYPRSGRARL